MKVQCPNCKKVLSVPDEYKGKRIRCKGCQGVLIAKPLEKQTITPEKPKLKPIPIVVPIDALQTVESPQPTAQPEPEPSPIKCPNCGSTQIMGGKKGFSGGKAVGGALILGPLGLLAGLHRSKKTIISCLNCGHKWEPLKK